MAKENKQKSYSFLTDQVAYEQIETKSGKKYFITGYISVPEIDLYNDLVTPNALKSMFKQINDSTIMLDYDHEAWRESHTLIPVGKIVDAKIDDRGLWVKAELNRASPKFKDMWDSIKGGFIKAFSIAFKPLKTVMKTMGETKVRLIEDLQLLNVALTGAPVNASSIITNYGMKSIMLKAIDDMGDEQNKNSLKGEEVNEMGDEEESKQDESKPDEGESKSDEDKSSEEESQPEEKANDKEKELNKVKEELKQVKEELKQEKDGKKDDKDEDKKKVGVEQKAIDDLKEEVKSLKEEVKSLKDTDVFKSQAPTQPETKSEDDDKSSVLGVIR